MMNNKTIILSKPKLQYREGCVRLVSDVRLPDSGTFQPLWIEVDSQYGKKLVNDRLDGFLVWFLPFALRNGFSILCEAPVSRRLLYQLRHYQVAAAAKFLEGFRMIDIVAEATDQPIHSSEAVATGWTGGVDSMYTLVEMGKQVRGYSLTHLVIMSCGALESVDNSSLVRKMAQNAECGIAVETNLEVVRVDSNIECIICESFLSVSDYRLAGAALCLQGLLSKFYISSTYSFSLFYFVSEICSYYSLFSIPNFCTENLSFFSIGGALRRLEKIRIIAKSPLAQKYLHPCIMSTANCGKCGKCIRTMCALYAIDELDKFGSVFDIKGFYAEKDWYLSRLLSLKENPDCREVIDELVNRGEIFGNNVIRQARILNSARKVVQKNKEYIQSRLEKGENS